MAGSACGESNERILVMTEHDAHLIAARPVVVPSQSARRFAIARVPRLPRWLRQPRHVSGACWRWNTLGSAPRPKKSWVALLVNGRGDAYQPRHALADPVGVRRIGGE